MTVRYGTTADLTSTNLAFVMIKFLESHGNADPLTCLPTDWTYVISKVKFGVCCNAQELEIFYTFDFFVVLRDKLEVIAPLIWLRGSHYIVAKQKNTTQQ